MIGIFATLWYGDGLLAYEENRTGERAGLVGWAGLGWAGLVKLVMRKGGWEGFLRAGQRINEIMCLCFGR